MSYTISQIKEILDNITDTEDPQLKEFETDTRKGVQTLLSQWNKRLEKEKEERERYLALMHFERLYKSKGYSFIAGIDEVGRGPIAGPVVAAAVILEENTYFSGLNDSKQITEKKREELFDQIHENSIAVGIGMVHSHEIDEINIYQATKKAMLEAINQLEPVPDFLLIDAMPLETPFPSESIIKGDAKSVSIAAASVIAKVTRDRYMADLEKAHPGYGFDKHKGYGTKEHLDAIQKLGVIKEHRRSFAPIKEYTR
ncbi:ribonuclease HII [Bacillus carboniphilus]|uniref:Ribonuclease HII n=1 Tax=Bacillus carboniphilus TaxID=86663 RepID=A0ABP3G3B0_9BACI